MDQKLISITVRYRGRKKRRRGSLLHVDVVVTEGQRVPKTCAMFVLGRAHLDALPLYFSFSISSLSPPCLVRSTSLYLLFLSNIYLNHQDSLVLYVLYVSPHLPCPMKLAFYSCALGRTHAASNQLILSLSPSALFLFYLSLSLASLSFYL